MTGAPGLLRTGGVTFAGIAVGAAANLLLAQVVAHGLGAAGTGLFFQAVALFLITANALQLGADTALVRTLSRRIALGERAGLRVLVRSALLPIAALSTGVALLVAVLAEPIARSAAFDGTAGAAGLLRLLAPFLVPGALLAVLLGGTRGIGSTLPYTALQNLALPLGRLVVVGAALGLGLGLQWIVLGWAAVLAPVAAAAAAVLLVQLRTVSSAEPLPPGSRREFWAFALPRGGSTALERALDWSGVLVVLAIAGPVAGGVYAVVNRCVSAGAMIDQAARIVAGPRISRALALDDRAAASALFLTVTRTLVVVGWPFYLLLAIWSPAVLSLFGPEFVAGAVPMALVSLAMMAATTVGMVQSVLLMGGRSWWQLRNRSVQLAVLLVVTAALVPSLGLTGAALGWIVAIAVDTALAGRQVWCRLGIRTSPRALALPAVTALVVVGGGGSVAAALLGQTLPGAVIASMAVLAAYAAVLAVLRRPLGLVRAAVVAREPSDARPYPAVEHPVKAER